MYIFSQTLVRPKAARLGVPALPADAAQTLHTGVRGAPPAPGWVGGDGSSSGELGAQGTPLPKLRLHQPSLPHLRAAWLGRDTARAGAEAQQLPLGEGRPPVPTELSVHSGRLPVSLVIPSPRGRTPSLERWCGLPRSLQTAGAFSGQALFGARASRPAGVLRGKGPGSGCLL